MKVMINVLRDLSKVMHREGLLLLWGFSWLRNENMSDTEICNMYLQWSSVKNNVTTLDFLFTLHKPLWFNYRYIFEISLMRGFCPIWTFKEAHKTQHTYFKETNSLNIWNIYNYDLTHSQSKPTISTCS